MPLGGGYTLFACSYYHVPARAAPPLYRQTRIDNLKTTYIMRRNAIALAAALIFLTLSSCAKTPSVPGGNTGGKGKTEMNYELPKGQETIRVLFIGNSFTLDATDHLPGIFNAAGIRNFSMERAYHGGYTLVAYNQNFDTPSICQRYKFEPGASEWAGGQPSSAGLNSSLDDFWDSGKPYDIVVMQEYTETKYAWAGYTEHQEGIDAVKGLMEKVRAKQPDKEPVFVYLMSQVSAKGRSILTDYWGNDRSRMFDVIAIHAKQVLRQTGIKYLIATGTAIENLRTTSLNVDNGMDLSRDLYHLDKGISCYAASCTVFETILGPCVDKTMEDNSYRFPNSSTTFGSYTAPVTDKNAPIAQTAALKAVETPLEVTDLSIL